MSSDVATYAFPADISEYMAFTITKFSKDTDIFLRELLSNASNALDRVCSEAMMDRSCLYECPDLYIEIKLNERAGTLIIRDTGIGMTKDEMINKLCTISTCVKKGFADGLAAGTEGTFIGRHGLGFNASYLVARNILVISKHKDECQQHVWRTSESGSFTVGPDKSEPLAHGTKVVLHIDDDKTIYLNPSVIRAIVEKYAYFIRYSIHLVVERQVVEELTDAEGEQLVDCDKPKRVFTRKVRDVDELNDTMPIWMCVEGTLTRQDYSEFYKFLTGDCEVYAGVEHFYLEDPDNIYVMLFIPHRKPSDLWQRKRVSLKFYVQHVFITDKFKELLPDYLHFVSGIVDTDILPLHGSLKAFQQHKELPFIRKLLVRKILGMIENLTVDERKYDHFYDQFGTCLKLGVHEDADNRAQLIRFLRFYTSSCGNRKCSLDDYISRMPLAQKHVYFVSGVSLDQVGKSAFAERVRALGFEVVYMVEPLEEYIILSMSEYSGKPLFDLSKEELPLPWSFSDWRKRRNDRTKYKHLCEYFQSVLGNKVEKVVVSNRLVESPCCVVTSHSCFSANMERILKAQSKDYRNSKAKEVFDKKLLEINPNHPIMENLRERLESVEIDKKLEGIITLLYNAALIAAGHSLDSPKEHMTRIIRMIGNGLDIKDVTVPKKRIIGDARDAARTSAERRNIRNRRIPSPTSLCRRGTNKAFGSTSSRFPPR